MQIVSTGYQPRTEQLEMHRCMAKSRFSVLVCHRRMGKTVAAVNALIDAALRFKKYPNGRFAYVAPFYTQAKDVSWLYFKQYTENIPGIKVSEGELTITFPHNGNRIKLYGADNADRLRGLYYDGIVLDEVADMRPNVWGEIVSPALEDRRGWALFIGTPKGINLFSERYYHAVGDDDWYAGFYPASKTGIFTVEQLAKMKKNMTESQYAQEMECDFAAAVDNALIPLSLVIQASGKFMRKDDVEASPKILGIDVARYGDDRSVLFPRQGLIAFKPKVYKGVDNMELAAIAANAINKWNPDAVFIDAGRGEGVIDRLRQLGHDVVEVNFGGKASDDHYVNKRAEMWDGMRRWLEAGGCLPESVELQTDLCAPLYSYANAANKFELESKDKMKERGLASPDLADALALTFAHPVAPTAGLRLMPQPKRAGKNYNPIKERMARRRA